MIWLDVTSTLNWQRPPVGIIRTEIETIKFALENPEDFGFLRFQSAQTGPVEVLPSEIQEKIALLGGKNVELGNIHNNFFRKKPNVNLSALRDHALAVLSRLPSRISRMLFLALLPFYTMLLFAIDSKNSLRVRLAEWKTLAAGSYLPKVGEIRPKSLPSKQVCSSKHCPYSLLKEGDTLLALGLSWDFLPLDKIFFEKHSHGFQFHSFVYDLIPIKFEHFVPTTTSKRFFTYMTNLVWAADKFFCISKATEFDLKAFVIGEGIAKNIHTEVVTLGADQFDSEIQPSEFLELSGKKFLLVVSTIERRKNHELLYRIYSNLVRQGKTDLPYLVFVGFRGWHVDDLLRDIEMDTALHGQSGEPLIMILENVSDTQLAWLYRNALFSLFPSWYEGWGLPIVESLAHGTPAIVSSAGACPEAAQGYATIIDPLDASAWQQAILEFLEKPKSLANQREKVQKFRSKLWADFSVELFSKVKSKKGK